MKTLVSAQKIEIVRLDLKINKNSFFIIYSAQLHLFNLKLLDGMFKVNGAKR